MELSLAEEDKEDNGGGGGRRDEDMDGCGGVGEAYHPTDVPFI